MSARDRHYDRAAASRVLAQLAVDGVFASGPVLPSTVVGGPRRIGYTPAMMTPEPGSHLTLSQRLYLERFMRPCPPEQVSSATHRISWTDSDGIANTGHYVAGGFGPVVPIVVRETLLALWHDLAANRRLVEAALELSDDDFDVLAATTTDQEPMEVFRIGMEAAGRALAQHAMVAHRVGFDTPAAFAAAMRRSGLFGVVAASWYWELQASTYRRGMVPVVLERYSRADGDERVRYSERSTQLLTAMKQQTIADAHRTMSMAMTEEGLTAAEAVQKYHTELDLIAKQYALMDPDTASRCLALTPNVVAGSRFTVLTTVVDTFVDAFTRLLDLVAIEQLPADAQSGVLDRVESDAIASFHVPDMNCRHCRLTIAAVLESHGVEAADIDLTTKQVVAQFGTSHRREIVFAAIRDSGYTVVR